MPNTTNYNVNLPSVGADEATWGQENNDAHQAWDTLLKAVNDALALKQQLDATLTALAALDGSPGLLRQIGADTFSKGGVSNADWLGTGLAIVNGGTGASTVAAARTNLGLGNVDNTGDASKPVSTAQAAADALKLNLTGGTLTGGLTAVSGAFSSGVTVGGLLDAANASGENLQFGATGAPTDAKRWRISTDGAGTVIWHTRSDTGVYGEPAYAISRTGTVVTAHQFITGYSERLRVSSTAVTASVPMLFPTAAPGTNTTQGATTAFVQAATGWTAWTPTVSVQAGTLGSYTVNYAEYNVVGNVVTVRVKITQTSPGSGQQYGMTVTTPPGQISITGGGSVSGREAGVTGYAIVGTTIGAQIQIFKYDNTYPGIPATTGHVWIVEGSYRAS